MSVFQYTAKRFQCFPTSFSMFTFHDEVKHVGDNLLNTCEGKVAITASDTQIVPPNQCMQQHRSITHCIMHTETLKLSLPGNDLTNWHSPSHKLFSLLSSALACSPLLLASTTTALSVSSTACLLLNLDFWGSFVWNSTGIVSVIVTIQSGQLYVATKLRKPLY